MAAHAEIDQNLYSRQLGTFGLEAMGKLIKMDVLIVGMRGLGVEIAKNLILAGPHSVTIYDPEVTTLSDTGTNYYLTAASVGKPRAEACVEALAELNQYVRVGVLPEATVTDAVLGRFHCVVATNTPRATLVQWNTFCRSQAHPIPFIAADVLGVAGYAFSDFGPSFVVKDKNGENSKSAVLTGIFRTSDPAKLTVGTHDSKRHGFDEGDHVVFREVDGMTALNDGRPRAIANCKAHSFDLLLLPEEVETAKSWPDYAGNGVTEQTNVPVSLTFGSLSDRETSPVPSDDPMGMLLTPDLGKFGRSEQLHVAVAALEKYRAKHGSFPPIRDAAAASEVVAMAKEWASALKASGAPGALQLEEVDEGVVSKVAMLARTELPALCAFFGGVVAQEVVKVTGKFTPLRQWLYLDSFEVLPEATPEAPLPADEFTPTGTRYDQLIAILGRTLQSRVMDQRVFVVGAGALGCEFLKNYALMGVGCGPRGRITVTDMDRIEVSNLNRQFLFRNYNVGQPKSVTAAAAARAMNAELKVEALETPVGEDTEGTFNDAFWEGLDVVTNALDNIKARQYVDGRCVWYAKPLLESGTLGTKANTQVVVPHKTESYSDSQDPPEESIPMCTLRNFPHAIEHCIEWARDLFQGSFNNAVQDAAAFVADPEAWLRKAAEEPSLGARRAKLEGVVKCLKAAEGASFSSCVEIARLMFNGHFSSAIQQLLHNFPPDYVDKDTGVKFWSGVKRAPTPAVFDLEDTTHYAFLMHATALVAANYGVALPSGWDSRETLAGVLSGVKVPPFVPRSVTIKTGENDQAVEGADDDRDACETITKQLSAMATGGAGAAAGAGGLSGFNLTPAEFEKDDDSNHHIDFITAASNLRARNYKIREATRHEVKMTAGKIIPAIATTTCMVTGLVALEFYKRVAGRGVDATRNSFVNLAVNVYSMSEPGEPKRVRTVAYDPIALGPIRAQPEGWTRWDKLVVQGKGMTLAGLEAWLKSEQKVDLSMVTAGKTILYNPMMYARHRGERGPRTPREVYEQLTGAPVPPGKSYIVLECSTSDDDGDVLLPPVQFFFE